MTLANRGNVRVLAPHEAGKTRHLFHGCSVFSRVSCVSAGGGLEVSEKGQFFTSQGPVLGLLEKALESEQVLIRASSATGNAAEPALDTLDILQFTQGKVVLDVSETTYFQNPSFNKTKAFSEKKHTPTKNDVRARTSYRFTAVIKTVPEDLRYLLEKAFSMAHIEVSTYDAPALNGYLAEQGFAKNGSLVGKKPIKNTLNLTPLGVSEVSDLHEFYEFLVLLHLQSDQLSKRTEIHSGISDYEVPLVDFLPEHVPRDLCQTSFKNINYLSVLELLSDNCISISASSGLTEVVFFKTHGGTVYIWEVS